MLACKLCGFTGDPDQYCLETLYFCDFSEGGGVQTPCPPPLDPPMKDKLHNILNRKHMIQLNVKGKAKRNILICINLTDNCY